jgi:hypothetical protein
LAAVAQAETTTAIRPSSTQETIDFGSVLMAESCQMGSSTSNRDPGRAKASRGCRTAAGAGRRRGAWIEARGPAMSLHGAIDDATGTVLALHFRPTEDLHGYTTVLSALAAQYGLPPAFYGDRLNVFLRNEAHGTLEERKSCAGPRTPPTSGRCCRPSALASSPPALDSPSTLAATLLVCRGTQVLPHPHPLTQ